MLLSVADSMKIFGRSCIRVKCVDSLSLPSNVKQFECVVGRRYLDWLDRVENFEIRADDIWIDSFGKAGTTWIMNIANQLKNNLNYSLDQLTSLHMYFERSTAIDLNDLDKDSDIYEALSKDLNGLFEKFDSEPSPRLLKSHFPAFLLPKQIWTVKPKLIYVYRDVKDVAISMYHMYKKMTTVNVSGTKEDFFDHFLNDTVIHGPFHDHVNSFLRLNELDHVLLMKYEDMVADPFAGVKKISEFLGYSYTDDQLKELTDHVSFENMRQKHVVDWNRFPNGFNFYRRGKPAAYIDEMSPEYIQKFNDWEREANKKFL